MRLKVQPRNEIGSEFAITINNLHILETAHNSNPINLIMTVMVSGEDRKSVV